MSIPGIDFRRARERAMDGEGTDWANIVPDVPMINLSSIEWPDNPNEPEVKEQYGPKHHQMTAMLASHLGRVEGLDKFEVDALWCAGSFHDLKRTKPFGYEDPGHGKAAADFVDGFLSRTEYWREQKMRELCCRLIANHPKNSESHDDGLIMHCLRDADMYEAVRIAPGTMEGITVIKNGPGNPDNMKLGFTKEKANLRQWMNFRGWR